MTTDPAHRRDLTVEQGVDSGPPVDELPGKGAGGPTGGQGTADGQPGAGPPPGAPTGYGNGELAPRDAHFPEDAGPGQELSAGEG